MAIVGVVLLVLLFAHMDTRPREKHEILRQEANDKHDQAVIKDCIERKQVRYPEQNYQVFYGTSDGRPVCWTEKSIRSY